MPTSRFSPEILQAMEEAVRNKIGEPLPGITSGAPRVAPQVPFTTPPPNRTWLQTMEAGRPIEEGSDPNMKLLNTYPPTLDLGNPPVELGARIVREDV